MKIFTGMFGGKTQDMNVLTTWDYYDRLKLIALSLFEWEGLPESCNPRFLESALYTYGRAVFIEDTELGLMTLKCTPSGEVNFYEESLSYTAYGVGYSKDFPRDECILIRNNYLERSTDNSVILFASRLTECERTIDVNIKAQKTPVLLRCSDKDRLTVKNLYDEYDGNKPFILGSKSLDMESIKVLKTDAPYVADKIQLQKERIWNEALTFFGINSTTEKRERLISDEVNANNEVIDIMGQSMLLTRQEACKQINKKYGLNVTVKMRTFTEEADEPTERSEE